MRPFRVLPPNRLLSLAVVASVAVGAPLAGAAVGGPAVPAIAAPGSPPAPAIAASAAAVLVPAGADPAASVASAPAAPAVVAAAAAVPAAPASVAPAAAVPVRAGAAAATPAAPTPAEIVAAAPASAWRRVPADRLLAMTLGDGQRVLIELAPGFAPAHVRNILALARAGWWDGAAIVREQDNYVVQWARMPEGQALPNGVAAHPPAEYDRPAAGIAITPLGFRDSYAPVAGWAEGFPVAGDGDRVWLAHCYGMVGVGRDMPPNTGSGEELYAVNGQAPRQLDRNIALVGRVVAGMDVLSALPRGTAALGFYAEPGQRVPIRSVRVAADLPEAQRPAVEILPPDGAPFAAALAARANRRDPFFVRPAGSTDLCNVPVPSRRAP